MNKVIFFIIIGLTVLICAKNGSFERKDNMKNEFNIKIQMATKKDCEIKEISSDYREIKVDRKFSKQEIEMIKMGFIPTAMEDKWFLYFENNELNIYRSWTGICIFKIKFEQKKDEFTVESIKIGKELDENNIYNEKYYAEIAMFLIDRVLLDKNVQVPIAPVISKKFSNRREEMMYKHGLVGNALSNKEKLDNMIRLERERRYVKKFNNENDEILELFELSPYFFKESEIKKYRGKVIKAIRKNNFNREMMLRYMIVGMQVQISGMKKYSSTSVKTIRSKYSEQEKRKFYLFEKYYGKELNSIIEYSKLFTIRNLEEFEMDKIIDFVVNDIPLRKGENDVDEIFELFFSSLQTYNLEDMKKFRIQITEAVDKTELKNKILLRIMVIDLSDNFMYTKVEKFSEILEDKKQNDYFARKVELFEKYYGKKLKSADELYEIFTDKLNKGNTPLIGNIKLEDLKNYIITGDKKYLAYNFK